MNSIRTVKPEPDYDNLNCLFKTELIQQKDKYDREMIRLQKTHEEQICKLCNELDKTSTCLHQCRLELDSMRLILNTKDKQLKTHQSSSNEDLPKKIIELTDENTKLKNDLSDLTMKYQTLSNEMQDARQYVLKMIANLD